MIANDSAAYDNDALDGTGASVYTTRASAVSLAPSASLIGPTGSSRRASSLQSPNRAAVASATAVAEEALAPVVGVVATSLSHALATSPARLVVLGPEIATAVSNGNSGIGSSIRRQAPLLLGSMGSLPGVWVAVVDEFGQLVPSAVAEQLAIEASAADMKGAQMRLVGLTR